MTGKELLFAALRNQPTPRPAWVPFVGVHGAQLIGVTATEYLKSADLLVKGLTKAHELYKPDGLPIVFDLQMEAELLGCQLHWADDGPPSVQTHPLEEGKSLADLPNFDPEEGRFPVALEALRTLKGTIGDEVGLYGLICGPFTLALHLLGNEIFMQMYDCPDYVKAVVAYCAAVGKKAAAAYLENGADVVAVVDPMVSQISPEHFAEFVHSPVSDLFSFINDHGGLSSLFVCGDATRNLEAMCRTTCHNLSIDENIPLAKVRDLSRAGGKSFGGNLQLTTVLLLGKPDDAKLDTLRCLYTGGGCGFVLAPGCDLPYATPAANLQAVAELVHDEYKREVARRTIVPTVAAASDVKLPDYASLKEVMIDVITLDSASCAPCQYMMGAATKAAEKCGLPVKLTEYKITSREGLAMMGRLGVKNIPTICLDGQAKFVSLIPDTDTLVAAIKTRKGEKGR